MSYRDIRGDQAKEISRELGITGKYNGSHLVEVREKDDAVSVSAHAARTFATITMNYGGGFELVQTDADRGEQRTTIVDAAGKVSMFQQAWDASRGPIGNREALPADQGMAQIVRETAATVMQLTLPLLPKEPVTRPRNDQGMKI